MPALARDLARDPAPAIARTADARDEASAQARESYTVAVRTLCEFTAKQGDLDRRFTPSPTAQQGIEGHALVAARRAGAGYRAEVALSAAYGPLRVRGRADGYDAERGRVEEVKTHRGPLERQPANHRALHWAQLEVYGALLCERHALEQIELALVYFDVASQRETVFVRRASAHELRAHFVRRCEAFLAWARLEIAHRASRDAALGGLAFSHAGFRSGQRPLAEAVYRAAVGARCLLAQAPTGIGKTIGTLFPLLKATPAARLDKIYFLTAKTSGRALALGALAALRQGAPALPLRTLELVAREKACEHPEAACHGDACPLAKGFYDRLPGAREAALAEPTWDRAGVRALALEHGICPYYLAQDLARWSDVIVGDYNHYFDGAAMLHALAAENGWRVGLLVDEAHNLVERARAMYSAGFDETALALARRHAPAALRATLARVARRWRALEAAHPAPYQVLAAAPQPLLDALQQAANAVSEHAAEQPAVAPDPALQAFHFEALRLLRLAEAFGTHSLFDLRREDDGVPRLALRNVLPAPFLAPRFALARTATLFSATLAPARFYAQMLGLPADAVPLDVASPFDAGQLEVRIAGDISTRYRHRPGSLAPICESIARQFAERPGNYLAFFGSFEYLTQCADLFERLHPRVPAWRQQRGMGEAAQAQYLARFREGGRGVGFAVLGGAFAEGVDLPGDRLVGAFVATLGMPQVNPVNEQMRERIDALCGTGHDYTYLVPGLRKVVQAAGRVIRTPEDRGVVHLLDDRFLRRDVRALLPAWWVIDRAPAAASAPARASPEAGQRAASAAGEACSSSFT